MTDKWMDDCHTDGWTHRKIMLLLHILTMRSNVVASSIEFRPVVQEEIVGWTDGRTDEWRR